MAAQKFNKANYKNQQVKLIPIKKPRIGMQVVHKKYQDISEVVEVGNGQQKGMLKIKAGFLEYEWVSIDDYLELKILTKAKPSFKENNVTDTVIGISNQLKALGFTNVDSSMRKSRTYRWREDISGSVSAVMNGKEIVVGFIGVNGSADIKSADSSTPMMIRVIRVDDRQFPVNDKKQWSDQLRSIVQSYISEDFEIDEAFTMAQRLKAKRNFQKNKAKIKIGRKKAEKKVASRDTLTKRARKDARKTIEKKLLKGKSKADLSFSQRQSLEKKLATKKGLINKLAKRAYKDVKKRDQDKRKPKKESYSYEDILGLVEAKESFGYIKFAGKKLKVKIIKLTKDGAVVEPTDGKLKGKQIDIKDNDLISESRSYEDVSDLAESYEISDKVVK